MLEIDKNKLLIQEFPNISEYYNYIKKTPRRKGAEDSSDERGSDRTEWTGTRSLDEAYGFLVNGDEKAFKRILEKKQKLDITKILGNKVGRNRPFNDIVGFQPDVSAFLKGVPTNMINQKPLKVSQKILNIFLDGAVSCMVSSNKIEEAGVIYASVIDILEKRGYRCNLYIMDCSEYEGYKYLNIVRVKTDREPFNLKKLAFPLVNPSYFRRIGFKWIESCPLHGIEPTDDGYGKPINDKKEIKKIISKYMKVNPIIWRKNENYTISIDKILENLEKDGIKIEGE